MIIGNPSPGMGGVNISGIGAILPNSAVGTGTSINVTAPTTCRANDLLVAVVMHRDTITLVPGGWALVDSTSCTYSGGTQYLSVYSKLAVAADIGATFGWAQATSVIRTGQILSFRSSTGLPFVTDHDISHINSSAAFSFSTAVSTATANKQMGVMYAAYALTATSPLQTQMLLSLTNSLQETINTAVNNYLCGGVVPMKSGDTTNGTISSNANATGGGWAGVSLVIGNGTWSDTFTFVPTTDGSGYNGFTLRQVYAPSILTTSGSLVRLVLGGGSSGGCSIDALYIGQQAASGDPYDMTASAPAPTQFLVNASGSFSIPSGGSVITDPLAFAFDHTKTYVIAAHFNGTPDDIVVASGTSVAGYYKAAVSEASVANVSGYSARPAGQALLITEIQVAL